MNFFKFQIIVLFNLLCIQNDIFILVCIWLFPKIYINYLYMHICINNKGWTNNLNLKCAYRYAITYISFHLIHEYHELLFYLTFTPFRYLMAFKNMAVSLNTWYCVTAYFYILLVLIKNLHLAFIHPWCFNTYLNLLLRLFVCIKL